MTVFYILVLCISDNCGDKFELVNNVNFKFGCLRPYHQENTGSRLITEVKPGRAKLVLGWVTAWEYFVL